MVSVPVLYSPVSACACPGELVSCVRSAKGNRLAICVRGAMRSIEMVSRKAVPILEALTGLAAQHLDNPGVEGDAVALFQSALIAIR